MRVCLGGAGSKNAICSFRNEEREFAREPCMPITPYLDDFDVNAETKRVLSAACPARRRRSACAQGSGGRPVAVSRPARMGVRSASVMPRLVLFIESVASPL